MKHLVKLASLVGTLLLAVWVGAAGAQEYPPTTIEVGGTVVTRGGGGAGTTGALPFTGSSHTTQIVLVAVCLVMFGAVLVFGAYRRRRVFQ